MGGGRVDYILSKSNFLSVSHAASGTRQHRTPRAAARTPEFLNSRVARRHGGEICRWCFTRYDRTSKYTALPNAGASNGPGAMPCPQTSKLTSTCLASTVGSLVSYNSLSRAPSRRAAEPTPPSTGSTGHHGRAALGAGERCATLRDARGAARSGEALRGSPRPLGLERLTSSS